MRGSSWIGSRFWGEGTEAAGARRRLQAVEERRMDREQRAHHLGLMLGRAILRRGDIYMQ